MKETRSLDAFSSLLYLPHSIATPHSHTLLLFAIFSDSGCCSLCHSILLERNSRLAVPVVTTGSLKYKIWAGPPRSCSRLVQILQFLTVMPGLGSDHFCVCQNNSLSAEMMSMPDVIRKKIIPEEALSPYLPPLLVTTQVGTLSY